MTTHMEPYNIPKVVYQTSKFVEHNLPQELKKIRQKNKEINPEHEWRYYDDAQCIYFTKKYFPEYLEAYNSIKPGAFKADIWRLMVILKNGGIYSDIPHSFQIPFDSFLKPTHSMLIVLEPGDKIHNAFFAASKNNPTIREMLNDVIENVKMKYYGSDSQDITGPAALLRTMKRIYNVGPNENLRDKLPQTTKVLQFKHREDLGFVIEDDNDKVVVKKYFDNYYKKFYDESYDSTKGRGDIGNHYEGMWQRRDVY
jgi:mannosyltransferase OCH1-like enzyme